MKLRAFGLVIGSACVFVACSSGSQVASKYVVSASVGPEGGSIPVTTSEDSTLAGTTIVIPPNALSKTTTISIGLTTQSVATSGPKGTKAAGPIVDFEPSGLVFAIPATVQIPVALPSGTSASSLFIEAVEDDAQGTAKQIKVSSVSGGIATFQVTGFTRFGGCISGATTAACSADSDCATGQVCVSGACTASTTACSADSDCPTGDVCSSGVCKPAATTCATGMTACSGACVDLLSDKLNCGSCATACSTGQTCSSGVCSLSTVTCAAGQTSCSGACVDLSSDKYNCGSCATACSIGETCSSGVCSLSTVTCAVGQTNCSGTCVVLSTDSSNCGACGTACPSGETCSSGVCAAAVVCSTDADCPSGDVCVSGVCQSGTMVCASGLTSCGGACVDTSTDASNCGACGEVCGTGSTCVSGVCTIPGTSCTTDSDCPSGQVCEAGVCQTGTTVCATGQTNCGGVCIDLSSDPANCGGCSVACLAGDTCSSGVCTTSAGCGGDADCPTGEVCVSGVCEMQADAGADATTCTTGQTDCGGVCVDISSDPSNCGACGITCPVGTACLSGACS